MFLAFSASTMVQMSGTTVYHLLEEQQSNVPYYSLSVVGFWCLSNVCCQISAKPISFQ